MSRPFQAGVRDGDLALAVRDLRIGFHTPEGRMVAVDGLSLDVAFGRTMAIVGESGCGKSASALGLMRLLPPGGEILSGSARLGGRSLFELPEADMRAVRGRGLAMIFQEPATSLNPVLTVGRQIEEVLRAESGTVSGAETQHVAALLNAVGIADAGRRLDDYPFQFSGGMKQRVMIAMALAGNPGVLIADEPTTALDVTVQAQILDLLKNVQRERGMGILLITHDLGIVARMANDVGVMYAGQLVERAGRDAFFGRAMHPYTRALFAAIPDASRRNQPLSAIAGQVPGLGRMPAGCRFAQRCPHAWSLCREAEPVWFKLGDGHEIRCHLGERARAGIEVVPVGPSIDRGNPRDGPALLDVQQLRVHFPIRSGVLRRTVGHVFAVDDVSISVPRGRTLALVGESGCGKTTIGKALLGLVRRTSGTISIGGQALAGLSESQMRPLRRKIQMIFQDPFASLNPRRSIGEIIREGMDALGIGVASERQEAVASLLVQVGLDSAMANRYPHEFSGGQRQRIAVARALAVQPELIVCDEPTSALDVSVQAQILNLLRRLQDELGVAYLFITHNFGVVAYLADEVAVMYLGRIVEQGPVLEVMATPRHPYTQALLASVPKLPDADGSAPEALAGVAASSNLGLAGEIPSASRPPSGCHYRMRCPRAAKTCGEQYPERRQVGESAMAHTVSCHFPD